MLDIPAEVKALFDLDSVRKNFRAVFDSGLVINNSDITWNSLRFRESVCSADSVTFGMAEASVLNFETVGVRNMLGEWFDAWMEVDATTLPAEMQTVRDDLDYPVYPVPLGRFVVTACPRNHEAMTKRKVTAMSNLDSAQAAASGPLSEVLNIKIDYYKEADISASLSLGSFRYDFDFSPRPELEGEVLASDERSITGSLGVYQDVGYSDGTSIVLFKDNRAVTVAPVGVYASLGSSSIPAQYSDSAMLRINYTGLPDDVDLPRIAEALASRFWGSGSSTLEIRGRTTIPVTGPNDPQFLSFLQTWLEKTNFFIPRFSFSSNYASHMPFNWIPLESIAGKWFTLPRYLKRTGAYIAQANYGVMPGPGSFGSAVLATTPDFRAAHPTARVELVAAEPERSTALNNATVVLQATKTPKNSVNATFSFDADNVLPKIAMALTELNGTFGCFKRDGGGKHLKQLDPEPVMRIERSQLSSAWWDEYDLAPIGSIAYRLGGEDYVYVFGDGQSQYVFQNSEIFDMIQNCTPEMVQAMMDEHLVPALQNLSFTPAEIDAVGLPYLEAGDCIELEAEDGTIIKTYVLEREMHGTQHLTDRITADGITITEVDL